MEVSTSASKNKTLTFQILVLGTEASGKSTFIRQMCQLSCPTLTTEEKRIYKKFIYRNIFVAVQTVASEMEKRQIPFQNPENQQNLNTISEIDVESLIILETQHSEAIKAILEDGAFTECFADRKKYSVPESAQYFFAEIDRLSDANYLPTEQDILHVYIPTNRKTEYLFRIREFESRTWDLQLKIIEMGGQKAERRKWIYCFEEISAVIFLVSASDYNQSVDDDPSKNKLEESIQMFQCLMSSFQNLSFILFINKLDILEEKLTEFDLCDYFSNYQGPKKDTKAATRFMFRTFVRPFETLKKWPKNLNDEAFHFTDNDKRYLESKRRKHKLEFKYRKDIFAHYTCMTDDSSRTYNLYQKLKDNITDIIFDMNLRSIVLI